MTCLQKIIDLEEKTMLKFDTLKNDYPSRRSVIYGRKGMVCTSQPLAAQAGLDIIKQGGNAIDAAIATAACMTVLGADLQRDRKRCVCPGMDQRGRFTV